MDTNSDDDSLDALEEDAIINNWREKLWLKLRSELLNVISDDAITRSIERYKQNIIAYMSITGEIENHEERLPTDEHIPYPEGTRYSEIIEDIWKHEMRHPTWSVEYIDGSNMIQKDPRSTLDEFDLSLNDHAYVFCYANEAGHFWNYPSDRKKMIDYINRHSLEVKLNTFKTLVSKYTWWKDRCNTLPYFKIYAFLEHYYFNGLAYLHRDYERCLKLKDGTLGDENS